MSTRLSSSSVSKTALHAGIKELIDEALGAESSNAKLCSKTTAIALGKADRSELDLAPLVEQMWKQIATNWVDAGCQWRGKENWRWALNKYLSEKRIKPNPEVTLNRHLANVLPFERWANEIPTGSGFVEDGGKAPGGLDLAYYRSPNAVCLIELKINAGNPISAAFQIVIYALVLNLARLVHSRLLPVGKPITISDQWRCAERVELRVLAPTEYYSYYKNLAWFEDRLEAAVAAFGKKHSMIMNFGFRCFDFDRPPADEQQLLKALARKVEWH